MLWTVIAYSNDYLELTALSRVLRDMNLYDITQDVAADWKNIRKHGCTVPIYNLTTWQVIKMGLIALSYTISDHEKFPEVDLEIQKEAYVYYA